MAFDFYQEIHTTQTLFRNYTASRKLRYSLLTCRSIKQSFSNILLGYLSRSVVPTGREMKIRRSMSSILSPWLVSINNNILKQLFADVFAIEVKDPMQVILLEV